MVGGWARGFTYTHVAVPVDFAATPLTIDASRLDDPDADQLVANAGLSDIVAFAADQTLGDGGSALISPNDWNEVSRQIKADHALLRCQVVFDLPASCAVVIAVKEGAKGDIGALAASPENNRHMSPRNHR